MSQFENQDTLHKVAESLQTTTSLIQKLMEEAQNNAVSMATFNVELRNMKDQIDRLSRTVEGSDGMTVVTRVSLVEQKQKEIEKKVEAASSGSGSSSDSSESSDNSEKWKFYGLLITTVSSLILGLVGLLK